MKTFFSKLWEKLLDVLPTLWGLLWIIIITTGSCTLAVLALKWFFAVMEVW